MSNGINRFTAKLPLLGAILTVMLTAAPPAAGQQNTFSTLILSPDPGEAVQQTTELISLSFIDPDRLLDVTSVRLIVDRIDLTSEATINGDVLVWLPSTPLSQGPHSIVMTMKARDGSALPSVSWNFSISAPPEGVSLAAVGVQEERKGLPGWALLQGNMTVEGMMTNVGGDGADFRREAPYTGKAWLNARGRLGGSWRYSLNTHFNSYESHVRQPINRYRFNLQSNWMTLTLGDVNPRMQELILWGSRVRGWSLDLRTGFFNVMVVSGRSRRAVESQLYSDDPSRVFRRGTYARDLFAVRPYFGSGRGLQLGITFMTVRDDTSSIAFLRTVADNTEPTQMANPDPKDNLVIGLDLSLKAFSGKLSFSYNNAFSLFANDITGGSLSEDELNDLLEDQGQDRINLPFDPEKFSSLFIINESMLPIDPRGMTNFSQQIRSTMQIGTHTLGARWRSIGGSYNTLGYSSLQKDRSGLRVQDSFRILDNRLGVTVGWESYEDNLDESKPATTGTSALTMDLSWQSDMNSPGFAFGYRTYGRHNDLDDVADGGVDEDTGTYSARAFFPVRMIGGLKSRFSVNYVSVGREDVLNPLTGTKNTYYLVGFNNRLESRPTEFSIMYGLNTSELTGFTDALTTFNRLLLKGRHSINENLAATADIISTTASSPETAGVYGLDYSKFEMTGGAEYYWSATSFATLRAGLVTYKDNRREGIDTSQLVVRIRVTQAF